MRLNVVGSSCIMVSYLCSYSSPLMPTPPNCVPITAGDVLSSQLRSSACVCHRLRLVFLVRVAWHLLQRKRFGSGTL